MAISTLYLTGFEHGFSGTAANMALGTGLIAGAGGSPTVTSGAARSGGYGLHVSAPLNTATWISATISGTKLLARFAVKVSTRPSSGTTVVAAAHASGRWLYVYVDLNGQLSVQISAGTIVTGATIDTTGWHLIELQADVSGNPATCDWKVDGLAQTQATGSSIADTWALFYLGSTNSAQQASVADYDDLILGNWTATTDWYGNGQVLGQLAGSDGTHATVGDFSPGDATTAYSGTVTTAYDQLNSPPATSGWTNTRSTTDNIGMRTANTSAYMEIKPVTTAQTGSANGVRALLAYSSSTTSANLAACDVRNSAGTVNALRGTTGGTGATYNFTGNNYAGVLVTKPVAGWTATEVNAIKMRFGGCTSSDINPVPTIQEWMIEVDWPAATVNNQPVSASLPLTGNIDIQTSKDLADGALGLIASFKAALLNYSSTIQATPNLVSYWRLGEASGSIIDSKDSNTGTAAGGIARNVAGLLVGDPNGAASGDGVTGSYVNVPNASNMNSLAEVTLECWLQGTGAWVVNSIPVGAYIQYFLQISDSGTSPARIRFYVRDATATSGNDTQISSGLSVLPLDTPCHVVGVYSGISGRMELWVNGVSYGQPPSRTPNANTYTGLPFTLFATSAGATAAFHGTVDEVALYSRALTRNEIIQHYTIGKAHIFNTTTLNASLGVSGATNRQTNKTLSAGLASTGALAIAKAFFRTLAASLGTTGSLVRSTSRTFAAAGASTGTLTKQTARKLLASVASVGSLAASHVFTKVLAASLALGGSLKRSTGKALSAGVASTGSLTRSTSKLLGGSLATVGALTKQTARAFVASLSSTASLLAESLVHHYQQALSAGLALSGSLNKATAHGIAAGLAMAATFTKNTAPQAMTAAVGMTVSFSKTAVKVFGARLASTGRLTKRIGKNFAARLGNTASLAWEYISSTLGIDIDLPTTIPVKEIVTKLAVWKAATSSAVQARFARMSMHKSTQELDLGAFDTSAAVNHDSSDISLHKPDTAMDITAEDTEGAIDG